MAVDGNGKAPLPSQLYAILIASVIPAINRADLSRSATGLGLPTGSFLPALMLAGYSLRPA